MTADVVRLLAPAKLTVSLRVVGVRADGYHELEAEMVSLDLADELVFDPSGDGLDVDVSELASAPGPGRLAADDQNLVHRALRAVGRRAGVQLRKRIPLGGGLGGGSADAAAVLRWAGVTDLTLAAGLGADVPFCVVGGRAFVGGIGEQVRSLPFEPQTYVLALPPFGVDTAAAYRAWDRQQAATVSTGATSTNDLEGPALSAEPRLAAWRDALGEATGQTPSLAGSGSTWFVRGGPEELGLDDTRQLTVDGQPGPLVVVRTVPPEWGLPPD